MSFSRTKKYGVIIGRVASEENVIHKNMRRTSQEEILSVQLLTVALSEEEQTAEAVSMSHMQRST